MSRTEQSADSREERFSLTADRYGQLWLNASDRGVTLVIKARVEAAGHDAAEFAGHSLRAGFLTEAAARGANIFKMREQSRHKSLEVLSDYVRNHELFTDHAGERFL